MRSYKTEGIILKRSNYGEADRILTAFTKHHGKIKIMAKGVRRIKSRRGPNVELFNWTTLFLRKGKNFDLLGEAEVKNSFFSLKNDLQRVGICYQICELIDGLCPEGQENRRVFDLSVNIFSQVATPNFKSFANFLPNFELELLRELGYWPKNKFPPVSIQSFIEEILERKLKTPRFLAQIQAL
ncbi:MAG: DNA repair protein RecO [bacterium]|nr:DNA repair protein RecO [bacterium]